MKKKGISLIVLIITIIVLITLAVAVILALANNNPVEAANEATFKNDLKNYQQELQMFIANEMMKEHDYDLTKLNADEIRAYHVKKGNLEEISGNINGVINSMKKEHSKILEVYEGKLVIKDSATKLQVGWAKEVNIGTKGMVIPEDWPDIRETAKSNSISLLADSKEELAFTTILNNTSASYTVEWGDGSVETFTSGTSATHTYANSKYYDIKIYSEGNDITEFKVTSGMSLLMCYINCNTLTSMEKMFENTSIQIFDVCDKSATSQVTNMSRMFFSCNSLTYIPEMDTGKVTTMYYMFTQCNTLTSIPHLDTGNVETMAGMFCQSKKLKTIPKLDTGNVTNMESMFYDCAEIISIPELDISSVTNYEGIITGCSLLEKIKLKNTNTDATISNYILDSLPSRGDKIYGTLDLTENVAIGVTETVATDKNWTIAK